MSDDLIKKLGENGGLMQINFGTQFLDGELAKVNRPDDQKLRALLDERGWRRMIRGVGIRSKLAKRASVYLCGCE